MQSDDRGQHLLSNEKHKDINNSVNSFIWTDAISFLSTEFNENIDKHKSRLSAHAYFCLWDNHYQTVLYNLWLPTVCHD